MTEASQKPLKQRVINRLRAIRWRTEATIALVVARCMVKFLPFKLWRWTLGEIKPGKQAALHFNARHEELAMIAGRWVRRTARRVPFEAVCLPQAMAGFWMLKRRGIATRIVFAAGVAEDEPGTSYHAWLMYGDTYLTGQDAKGSFTPLGQAPTSLT